MRRQKNFRFFLVFFCFLFCFLGFRFGPLAVEAKTVVISDNFDDGVLNPDLWEIYTNLPKQQPLEVREQNGRLEFLTDGTQPDLCSGVRLKRKIGLNQNFTVKVDFNHTDGSVNSALLLGVHNICTDQQNFNNYLWRAATCWAGFSMLENGISKGDEVGRWSMYKSALATLGIEYRAKVLNYTGFVPPVNPQPEDFISIFSAPETPGGPTNICDPTMGFIVCDEGFFISLFAWSDSHRLTGLGSYFDNFCLTIEEPDAVLEPVSSAAPVDTPPVVDSVDPISDSIIAEPVATDPISTPEPLVVDPVVSEPVSTSVESLVASEPTPAEPAVEPVATDPIVPEPVINSPASSSFSFSSSDLLPPKDPPIPDPNSDDGGMDIGGCFIQSLR